jgi:hypothetical protein
MDDRRPPSQRRRPAPGRVTLNRRSTGLSARLALPTGAARLLVVHDDGAGHVLRNADASPPLTVDALPPILRLPGAADRCSVRDGRIDVQQRVRDPVLSLSRAASAPR